MYNNRVLVLDISFWQDDNTTPHKVDFVKMKQAGADGVILRAGQNTWIDQDFLDYVAGAKAAGLPYGVYWFWDSRSSPKTQSDKLLSVINEYPKLGIWGDYEETYNGAYSGFSNYRQFLTNIENAFPNKLLGIYTAPYYWVEKTTANDREYAKKYPLWIANYGVSSPTIPYPWTKYVFWQFTSSGDGIAFGTESLEIDMNYFGGTLEEFKNYFSLDDIVVPPPTNGGTMKKGTLTSTTTSLRVRSGPSTAYPQTNGIYQGDTVYGELDSVSGWLHISKIDRASGTSESIDGWCSASPLYITLEDYTPPTTGDDDIKIYINDVLTFHMIGKLQ